MRCWTPLLALLLLAPTGTVAAECRPPTTLSEAIAARHEFVVKAKVHRVRPPHADGVVPVVFYVLHEYRGAPPQTLTVDFDPRQDPRALNFHRGDVWLLSTLPSGAGPNVRSLGTACTFRQLVGMKR